MLNMFSLQWGKRIVNLRKWNCLVQMEHRVLCWEMGQRIKDWHDLPPGFIAYSMNRSIQCHLHTPLPPSLPNTALIGAAQLLHLLKPDIYRQHRPFPASQTHMWKRKDQSRWKRAEMKNTCQLSGKWAEGRIVHLEYINMIKSINQIIQDQNPHCLVKNG